MSSHRSSERSLYHRLQQPDCDRARGLLESQLSTADTYEKICAKVNALQSWGYRSSLGEWCALPSLTPQRLSRYRADKHAAESRGSVLALIEEESESLLNAAAKNPSGVIAQYLRKRLSEEAVARFDLDAGSIDLVDLSRETARHAKVAQVDRKLDLDAEKIALDEKRIALLEKQSELERDHFEIAADTWKFTLAYLNREAPEVVDVLTKLSPQLLTAMEEWIEGQA